MHENVESKHMHEKVDEILPMETCALLKIETSDEANRWH